MLDKDIFTKQAWLYVVDGYKRNWKTLWLARGPRLKRIFIGHVNVMRKDFDGTIVELVSVEHRLQQNYHMENNNLIPGLGYLNPSLHTFEEV